jgi:tRNA pseudouridine13 synthase
MLQEVLTGEGEVEAYVGITAYANQHPGFQGILKERYSDFVVREVSLDDEVLYVKNISGAEIERQYFAVDTSNQISARNVADDAVDTDTKVREFIESIRSAVASSTSAVVGDIAAELDRLQAYVAKAVVDSDSVDTSIITVCANDKSVRAAIHQLVRNNLGHIAESDTVKDESGNQRIRIFLKKHLKSQKQGQRRDSGTEQTSNSNPAPVVYRAKQWPTGLGDYLRFTMIKENVDTISACNIVGKHLKIRPGTEGFQYAGTKDKRAVTVQHCTLYRRRPSELTRINNFHNPPIIRFGDFQYVNDRLKLGSLKGNRFTIALRRVSQDETVVNAACRGLLDTGFINYFGLQRFGFGGKISPRIGLATYISDWKTAVQLTFARREGDRMESLRMKDYFEQGKYALALREAPPYFVGEKLILEQLVRHPNDYCGAYERIAKNARLLCGHAYQSRIWNK